MAVSIAKRLIGSGPRFSNAVVIGFCGSVNNDVAENMDGVLVTVLEVLHKQGKKKTLTQPSPAKAGEG